MTRLQEIPESFSPINGQKLKILEILKIDFIYIFKNNFRKIDLSLLERVSCGFVCLLNFGRKKKIFFEK